MIAPVTYAPKWAVRCVVEGVYGWTVRAWTREAATRAAERLALRWAAVEVHGPDGIEETYRDGRRVAPEGTR